MVWIAIIMIIILWVTNIDFNKLNAKQELNIFTNNIKTNFELTRNNALSWKWIWTNFDVPKKWKIDYSMTNSWTIITNISNDWITWTQNKEFIFKPWFYISEIKCWELNEDESSYDSLDSWWTWSIIFEWLNITYDFGTAIYCDEETDKIIEITTKYKNSTKTITINNLNWLVEVK